MDRKIPWSNSETNGTCYPIYTWKGSMDGIILFLPVVGDAILIVLGLMRAHIGIVTISMSIGKLARYAILVAATLGIISFF